MTCKLLVVTVAVEAMSKSSVVLGSRAATCAFQLALAKAKAEMFWWAAVLVRPIVAMCRSIRATAGAREAVATLQSSPDQPLLDRAVQFQLPPVPRLADTAVL